MKWYFFGTIQEFSWSKETLSGPRKTSKVKFFVKMVDGLKTVNSFSKSSVLDVSQSPLSSVIRQKGESQTSVTKQSKQNYPLISIAIKSV